MLRFLVSSLAVLAVLSPAMAETQDGSVHVLKGRIIRSLAVSAGDDAHVLVGQKADKPGSAFVFRSTDGGRSWRFLNSNRPLHPQATDVQAVAVFSDDVLLAGTWKHGLYVSRDGGGRFSRMVDFPSNDIRDLQVTNGVIYAATARHGVFESTDEGQNWQAIGPGSDFFWSVTPARDGLVASSLENAVYRRHGGKWDRIFDADKVYAAAVDPKTADVIALAGETGLHLRRDRMWRKAAAGEKFSDVVVGESGRIVAGSWSNGLIVLSADGTTKKRLLAGAPVVHVQVSAGNLLVGTWGRGLRIVPWRAATSFAKEDIPLIAATLAGDAAAVRRLLAQGADPDTFDRNNNTALIFAARDGESEIARLLIAAGADPGWIDGEDVTPLILAAFKNHIEIVRLLLSHDVDRGQRDRWGRTASDYAARRGSGDPIYRLLAE